MQTLLGSRSHSETTGVRSFDCALPCYSFNAVDQSPKEDVLKSDFIAEQRKGNAGER